MPKIVLPDTNGGYNISTINDNFQAIAAELNNKVLYRDNPVGEVNTLQTNIDANGKRITNLPVPTLPSEAARLQDIVTIGGGAVPAQFLPFTPYLDIGATNVQAAIQEVKDDVDQPVGTAKIANSAVTTAKIADESITDVKISSSNSVLDAIVTKLRFIASGAGAVYRSLRDKLRDNVSVRDFGAIVDGVTDDTAAILAARTTVQGAGGGVYYGGKTYATGFFENLAPLAQEWVRGDATTYATDLVSSKPLIGLKLFNATPAVVAGYSAFGSRFDAQTKAGIDVSSTVTGLFTMQSFSTNSIGAEFNKTYQVALVANSAAMDATASASVEAFNAIVNSNYTGLLPQQVVGVEVDVGTANPGGVFGAEGAAYSVAYSAVLQGESAGNGYVAYNANTSSGTATWMHGAILSGASLTGLTINRVDTRRPETGVWVAAAGTYGIYIGAENKHAMNAGTGADYTYKPVIGLALGQEGDTSSPSHKLRFTRADASSVKKNADVLLTADGALAFAFDGTTRFSIDSGNGQVSIGGNKIIGLRETGWGTNTGATSKAAFDTATATTQQVAQQLAALVQDLKNHGLIG